jgi:hypothetical protein
VLVVRLVALLTLVLLLGLVAVGCGGDDEPETSATAEWADGFCTAAEDWKAELQSIGEDLADTSSFSTEALEQAAQEASDATDAFVDDIRGLGEPDTESGQAVDDAVQQLADTIEAQKADIEAEVEDLSGITDIASAGTEIASSLAAMFTALEQAFTAIDDADVEGDLETAFDQTESCDEVRGSNS